MKDNEKDEMSFLEHLEELRWHLIRSFLAIFLFAILAFIFKEIVFDIIILGPKDPEFLTNRLMCQSGEKLGQIFNWKNGMCINSKPLDLINIKMAGQFSAHIMISLVAGLIAAFPFVFYEFWRFIMPALHPEEKKMTRGAVGISSILFLLGVLFGYYIIAPLSIHFLGSYMVSDQIANQIYLRSYISTITSIVIASGVLFELPVVIFFLSKAGLVTPDFLRRYRKHSIVIILVLSAIITPPDVFSQVLVCLPLLVLYEISIIISARIGKSQMKSADLSKI